MARLRRDCAYHAGTLLCGNEGALERLHQEKPWRGSRKLDAPPRLEGASLKHAAAIDDALSFIAASNKRIAAMEAKAAKVPHRKAA